MTDRPIDARPVGDRPAEPAGSDYFIAELDRRFYGFVIDRLLLWTTYGVATFLAYHFLIAHGHLWAGVAVIAGVVVLAWLATAVLVGLTGRTPAGSAVGLRILSGETGRPIGLSRALVRGLVLGVATLPTFGFGAAALAVTAIGDPSGRRRGWHDLRARSVVVDIRPEPTEVSVEEPAPSPIVNLTALRLVPASPNPPTHVPARRNRVLAAPLPPRLGPTPPSRPLPSLSPRQGLGWPLVGSAPDEQTAAPGTLGPASALPAPQTAAQVSPAVPPAAPDPAAPDPVVPTGGPVDQELARRASPQVPVVPPPSGDPASTQAGEVAVSDPPSLPSPAEPEVARGDPPPGGSVRPRWHVRFDTGEGFEVSGLTLVGRRPEASSGEPAKRLVELPSPEMSLSKTHAQFQVVPDGALVVMDRGSTNGSILIRAGVAKQLSEGRPQTLRDGDRVRFGDREMTVTRAED